MSDTADRLRHQFEHHHKDDKAVANEAADELDTLQAIVDSQERALKSIYSKCGAALAPEIEVVTNPQSP